MMSPVINFIYNINKEQVSSYLTEKGMFSDIGLFFEELILEKKIYELNIVFVDLEESQALNCQWRQKDYATNVLSFPIHETFPESGAYFLGELFFCIPVIEQEAMEQKKNKKHHFQHLLLHGILHLLDYTHDNCDDSKIMEDQEILILSKLGIANPYEDLNE